MRGNGASTQDAPAAASRRSSGGNAPSLPRTVALRAVHDAQEIPRIQARAEAAYAKDLANIAGQDGRIAAVLAKRQLRAEVEAEGPAGRYGHVCCVRTLRRLGEYWYSFDEAASLARLQYLFIVPKSRGQGYGAATLAAIHDRLEKSGCKRIELNVFASNPNAMALYRSFGYVVDSCEMSRPLSTSPARQPVEHNPTENTDDGRPDRLAGRRQPQG